MVEQVAVATVKRVVDVSIWPTLFSRCCNSGNSSSSSNSSSRPRHLATIARRPPPAGNGKALVLCGGKRAIRCRSTRDSSPFTAVHQRKLLIDDFLQIGLLIWRSSRKWFNFAPALPAPNRCPGGEGVPDYVLLLQEPPPLFIDKSFSSDIMTTSDLYPMPRNSLHSGRKASYDVRSLGSDGNSPFLFYFV